MINVTPDNSVVLPEGKADAQPKTAREAVEASARTAMVLEELGMGFEMTSEDEALAHKIFADLAANKTKNLVPAELNKPEIAAKVGALLQHYDHQVVVDAMQLRTLAVNKLVLLADCGDPRYELKALEMIGKISDVGLFTEKSEITVVHKNADDLEKAIRDRVRRLIHSTSADVEPIVNDLEAELGLKEDAIPDDTGTGSTADDTAQAS